MSAWRIRERQGFAALFGIGSRHGSHEAPMIPTDPHLLVVDDDERLRALLQRYLATNGYRVSAARSAAEARDLIANMAFDLIILDVMMPGESGLDFAQALRQTSSIPILMLTALGESVDRIQGLERGADDYLPKPFEPRELLLRVNSLLRRIAPPPTLPPKPVKMGAAVFDPEGGRLARAGKPIKLTSAETALLQLFATHAGRPFSRTDLCKRLNVALERSIDVQVTRLRRKIEEDPKLPLYLQTVRGVGYMLVPDRPDAGRQ
jgi:two-component system phosphate regulon response regulator OmpR